MNMDQSRCPRILVAGVGNMFLGDDAFGVEVARRLGQRPLPEAVRVVDFGIRGWDLAYALLEEFEAVIIVDAVLRGGPPGTLYVLEPDPAEYSTDSGAPVAVETHNMDPVKVLRLAAMLGARVKRVLVVGCEPLPASDAEEMQVEMSEPVRAGVDAAISLVESVLAEMLGSTPEVASDRAESENDLCTLKEAQPCRNP